MLRSFLAKNNGWVLSLVAGIAAFGAYSSMYAFRKAFSAGTYEGYSFYGTNYKIALVIAQVLGYMISKFVGIRVVSGIAQKHRMRAIILLILCSWFSLALFAVVPVRYGIVCLFFNGLPLGMIWGLVFSYLEGRRNTEIMAAIMASSLVFASGFVKSVGRTLLSEWHISEFAMPFFTGLMFALPLLLFLYVLSQLPDPNLEDIAARCARVPMSRKERITILSNYWPGIVCIVILYLTLTLVRDIRDNFEVEIWSAMGYAGKPAIFTQVDFPVAMVVLVVLAMLVLVRNNMKAFIYLHYILLAGVSLAGVSAMLFLNSFIGPVAFMSMAALGLFLAYVPCNSILFERMISAFRMKGNVGFLMYIADALGYLGSVGILLYKQFGAASLSWQQFFTFSLLTLCGTGIILIIISLKYFRAKEKRNYLSGVIKTT